MAGEQASAPPFILKLPLPKPRPTQALVDHLAPLPDGLSAGAYRAVMQQVSRGLSQARRWGDGLRPDDAAHWFDFASAGAKRAFPSLPCWEGCVDCCREAPFRVTQAEWDQVGATLDAQAEAERTPLLRRALATLRPLAADLQAMGEAWTVGQSPGMSPAFQAGCPLLAGDPEGRHGCTVYEGRPAMCRAYGHAAALGRDSVVRPLICPQRGPQWLEAQVQSGTPDVPWPRWEPMWEAVLALSGGPGAWMAPLAWWLLRDLEAGRWPEALEA